MAEQTSTNRLPIPINKPFLPPQEVYQEWMGKIWESNHLTNFGPLATQLENELKAKLGLSHVRLINNGTVAIQLALRAFDLKGSIITTPFSYVATTSSIVYEGLTPIFVDIDAKTLNIDPSKIEAAIRPDTSAILATHVYGNICDVEAIDIIAKKHNLKVIYDAAHCFGTMYKGKSAFAYGDAVTTSFHATKVFHTIEGGAVFSEDAEFMQKIFFLMNFGHRGYEEYETVGVNGKNSEFHAAMGLANLGFVDQILRHRIKLYQLFSDGLSNTSLTLQSYQLECIGNGSYMPVIFESEDQMKQVRALLQEEGIFTRRYFYPSLNKLPYLTEYQPCPISEDIASRVLCLPLYFELTEAEVQFIIEKMKQFL